MIQLSGAGKRFGHKLLFENVDWLITPRDRIGLVGGNGTGKSTLMKILAGMDTFDYGTLTVAKGTSAGYLPQDGLTLSGRSVFAECMSVFNDLRAMETELESLTHSMAELDHTSAEYDAVADRYHRVEHEFRTRDGYSIEAEVGRVLMGLGFTKEDWPRLTDEFSGGWQMRLALAKLLLQKPNLLLLDEPTNHLDLEARNWLEEYLQNYPHAFVLISHDRYFLDVTVNKIAEIWNKRFWFYTGNYDKFLAQKTQRNEQLQAAYRNQRDRIEQLEVFINRFRYQATKAKQVQSRIKELEKIERIEVPPEEKTIHFSFPQPKPSGRIVAEFEGVAKSYPGKNGAADKEVFRKVNFMIERGDRIALVGVNGAGKSTLIKLLAGTEAVTRGEYRLGHNVEADYFAQDQYKELDADARILDDLGAASPRSGETELRSLLGCFLFSEDDVFKTDRRALRRRTRTLRAVAPAAAPGQLPAARRAHQPPRSARQRCAARRAREIYRHGSLRLARSLFHRQAGHARLRSRRRQSRSIPRQLRGLSLAQTGRAARRADAGRCSRDDREKFRNNRHPCSRLRCEKCEAGGV